MSKSEKRLSQCDRNCHVLAHRYPVPVKSLALRFQDENENNLREREVFEGAVTLEPIGFTGLIWT